jgi:hypothetical protein
MARECDVRSCGELPPLDPWSGLGRSSLSGGTAPIDGTPPPGTASRGAFPPLRLLDVLNVRTLGSAHESGAPIEFFDLTENLDAGSTGSPGPCDQHQIGSGELRLPAEPAMSFAQHPLRTVPANRLSDPATRHDPQTTGFRLPLQAHQNDILGSMSLPLIVDLAKVRRPAEGFVGSYRRHVGEVPSSGRYPAMLWI